MSEQDERQIVVQQRPTTNDQDEWIVYWKSQGQFWRTEPEIDAERQVFLIERRSIKPDIEKSVYPFKDIRLSRADVEWLLATHENGRGAVDWNDESQRERKGLDLRGANLRQTNLSGLPLARMMGGLTMDAWHGWLSVQKSMAGAQLQEANLSQADLKEAILWVAQLQEADLSFARLQEADLRDAHLEKAHLGDAHLEKADLRGAHLEKANLRGARLQGTNLSWSNLDNTTLDRVTLSDETNGSVRLADVRWGEVNLAVIDWKHVRELGDEQEAHQKKFSHGETKDQYMRLVEYKKAARANRQLAVGLREQGLNEEADHFAYRAQLLQRKVFLREYKFGRWLFSLLLAVLSGYGYRIWRILAAYLLTVSVFALAYFVLGLHYPPHLPIDQAFLESITAFHGRVFSEQFSPHTPQVWLTALEAIAGLIIEGVFIAMLIQRFFGK